MHNVCLSVSQVVEGKYESLQQHCIGLEREMGQVRAELREGRKRLKGVEKEAESWEGKRIGQEVELHALKKQVVCVCVCVCVCVFTVYYVSLIV